MPDSPCLQLWPTGSFLTPEGRMPFFQHSEIQYLMCYPAGPVRQQVTPGVRPVPCAFQVSHLSSLSADSVLVMRAASIDGADTGPVLRNILAA